MWLVQNPLFLRREWEMINTTHSLETINWLMHELKGENAAHLLVRILSLISPVMNQLECRAINT